MVEHPRSRDLFILVTAACTHVEEKRWILTECLHEEVTLVKKEWAGLERVGGGFAWVVRLQGDPREGGMGYERRKPVDGASGWGRGRPGELGPGQGRAVKALLRWAASIVRKYPGTFMSLVNSKVRVTVRALRIHPICVHEINFLPRNKCVLSILAYDECQLPVKQTDKCLLPWMLG